MIYFGILIAFSMLGSIMGALTLLPAIILIKNKKYKAIKTDGKNKEFKKELFRIEKVKKEVPMLHES